MNYYDYHVHSTNSMDGNNTVEEMCMQATRIGLTEMVITDHFECTEADENCSTYNTDNYFSEIEKVQNKYGKKVLIKAGVEIGQPHLYSEQVEKLLTKVNYDYVLASVHTVPVKGKEVDFGKTEFTDNNWKVYVDGYFEHMERLVEWNKYDCIGHIDLPKRYAANYGIKISESYYLERVREILKKVIYNGKGIEINTSGWRQAPKDCFPTFNIIKMYKELGGYIITTGSDSHRKEDLGKGIYNAVALAKYAGLNFITTFEERKPVFDLLDKIA